MAWWTYIGDTSSKEFWISALHDALTSTLKKNYKKQYISHFKLAQKSVSAIAI